MSKKESELILEDLERIASDTVLPWESLRGCTILITGATGLIGSLITKACIHYAVSRNMPLNVHAMVRDTKRAKAVFSDFLKYEGTLLHFLQADVRHPIAPEVKADYIIHTASVTSSSDFIEKPVDTIMTTIEGTRNILELARLNQSKSVVFVSSMEVYGKLDHEEVTEQDNGYMNPLNVRNSYPQSKRMAEALCAAYQSQFQVPVKTIRLTQTFGPGVSYDDQRVFAQFARAVVEGKDIILHTKGGTKRDYLYSADAALGILSVLLKGENGQAYNLSNPDSYISIRELAEMCSAFNERTKVIFDIDEEKARKYLGEIKIKLDNTAINQLNPFTRTDLKESFSRMLKCM